MADSLVAPLLLMLRDCLAYEVARGLGGPVCRPFVWWGPQPPVMDGCRCNCTDGEGRNGNGDAWVRWVELTVDPGTGSFTEGRNRLANGCAPGLIATIAMGTYRCSPVPDDPREGPLPAATETTSSLLKHADLMAILRVNACCPMWKDDTLKIGNPTFQRAVPIRQADCAGVEATVRVPLLGAIPCDPKPPAPAP